MKICGQCGSDNSSGSKFCLKCGKELAVEMVSQKRTEKSPSRSKIPFFLVTAVVVSIGLFICYQMLVKKDSEEAVVDQFIIALAEKDQGALKRLIVPNDSRLKVNEESIEALFTLIDKNPSMLQEIESSLLKESLASAMFSVYQNGKKYGVIPQHAIDTTGYFLSVDVLGDKTVIYLKDSEIGLIEKAGETSEFGPFLAGIYTVKGVGTAGSEKKEDTQKVTLSGAQPKVLLKLATAEEKKEEPKQVEKPKEVIEKVIVKEVIREVAPNGRADYYIIPYSGYSYLTVDSLHGLSKSELRLARNEIYARHGYIFKSNDLQNYFDAQSWYYRDASYSGSLSALEKYNVDLIKSYE